MSKAKAQGTAWETYLVNYWQDHALYARRLAEGGSNDPGDIELGGETLWTIEAKARANFNVTQGLAKAKAKTVGPVAVVWKRLTRKGDNARRSPDGERIVVIMDLATFTTLVRGDQPQG